MSPIISIISWVLISPRGAGSRRSVLHGRRWPPTPLHRTPVTISAKPSPLTTHRHAIGILSLIITPRRSSSTSSSFPEARVAELPFFLSVFFLSHPFAVFDASQVSPDDAEVVENHQWFPLLNVSILPQDGFFVRNLESWGKENLFFKSIFEQSQPLFHVHPGWCWRNPSFRPWLWQKLHQIPGRHLRLLSSRPSSWHRSF